MKITFENVLKQVELEAVQRANIDIDRAEQSGIRLIDMFAAIGPKFTADQKKLIRSGASIGDAGRSLAG